MGDPVPDVGRSTLRKDPVPDLGTFTRPLHYQWEIYDLNRQQSYVYAYWESKTKRRSIKSRLKDLDLARTPSQSTELHRKMAIISGFE